MYTHVPGALLTTCASISYNASTANNYSYLDVLKSELTANLEAH